MLRLHRQVANRNGNVLWWFVVLNAAAPTVARHPRIAPAGAGDETSGGVAQLGCLPLLSWA